MGLLDDAIREHLELKRSRGADPGEIAREEREALASAFDEGLSGREDHFSVPADSDRREAAAGETLSPAPMRIALADVYPFRSPDDAENLASVGQETAELDMRTILDADPDTLLDDDISLSRGTPSIAGPMRRASTTGQLDQGSLEW